MRGGLERWKRGVDSGGVRQAVAYAFDGTCDSHTAAPRGTDALAGYSAGASVTRLAVEAGQIREDALDPTSLRRWVNGEDPATGERRGRDLQSPDADLILDGTINAPKSFSLASLIYPELAAEFEALQDRLRDRIVVTWHRELNARRGAGGSIREGLQRIEVVELRHRRSRALDPHIHRHLWLNVKVLGMDGKWSNVDSRVAMKLHTVINAEGEIAARTDPEWTAALARHGYTLDEHGEIAQVAHAVRPMSRRSNQIETNRHAKMAEWRAAHPGQEPSHDVLAAIDRWAWAQGRPNKPSNIDENDWEQRVRDELASLDPALLGAWPSAEPHQVVIADLDRDLLARMAVVDADNRSASSGGRFSLFDVRAGAMRAVAASGVVADRQLLDHVIDDVVARAVRDVVDLLDDRAGVPAHVKGFMAVTTAALKTDLAEQFEQLSEQGARVPLEAIRAISTSVLPEGRELDTGQLNAASAIAGTDRLVAVTGPAGTGKTTMLVTAKRALERQGRAMLVVAPTKKAASVAAHEIGADASSLHALMLDYGWRWHTDAAGAEQWRQLDMGDTDATGQVYGGPRQFRMTAGDRIVVDEAGMVDLRVATALAAVAAQTGAGIAMVGDHLQARPVGHSGAMAIMVRRSTAAVELTAVHRFRDPTYAALTLRMRDPRTKDDALDVARELDARGSIRRAANEEEAEQVMVDEYFFWASAGRRVALVTATNAEAQSINEAIQKRRVDQGELDSARTVIGRDDQWLLEGDVVQTRRNDKGLGVENRAMWTVGRIESDGVRLVSVTDSGDTRLVPLDYVAEHVHLAYASTVHGIQGESTDAALVGPGVDAAGMYVGMTRGRAVNSVIALDPGVDAVEELAARMLRPSMEPTMEENRQAARLELGRAATTLPEGIEQGTRPQIVKSDPIVSSTPTHGGASLS